jgi:hypothetical protein
LHWRELRQSNGKTCFTIGHSVNKYAEAAVPMLAISLEFGAIFNPSRAGPFRCEPGRRTMVIAVDGDFFYGMSFALH